MVFIGSFLKQNIFTFRLRLYGIGYVKIRLGSDPLCSNGTGSKLERYGSPSDHLHKWTHLVPDSRSDLDRIHQVPCKRKAYPYHTYKTAGVFAPAEKD